MTPIGPTTLENLKSHSKQKTSSFQKMLDESLPPLENGDQLTRPEFERRYEAMKEDRKAELIEGVVYIMASPVRNQHHSEPHFFVIGWLSNYVAATPGLGGGDNGTIRLDMDNEPQPDVFLRIKEGGTSRLSQDDYIEGPPELVVEISSSTATIDLNQKKNAYRRNGVQEYLVWVTHSQEIRWFVLREGHYDRLEPDEQGIVRSTVFPGLWLDTTAMLQRNLQQVLSTLHQGLATPEHASFRQELERRAEAATPSIPEPVGPPAQTQ